MKFNSTTIAGKAEILANDDWAGVPHKFEADAKAGDIVEGKGVCLFDVAADDNPNGTVVYRGVINVAKLATGQLPTADQIAAFPMLKWLNEDGTFYTGA